MSATSVGDLIDLTALALPTQVLDGTDIAALQAVLGQSGRMLAAISTDIEAHAWTDPHRHHQRLAYIARACLDVAAPAASVETRLTNLAGATADAAAVLSRTSTTQQRWALAVTIVNDLVEPSRTMLADQLTLPAQRARLNKVGAAEQRIRIAALTDPPRRAALTALDTPLTGPWQLDHATGQRPTLEQAMSVLIQATDRRAPTLRVSEFIAVTLAAESLSQRARDSISTPQRDATVDAATGWAAARAALRPFNDGSRGPHPDTPRYIDIALQVHKLLATPDHVVPAKELADAAQHLPKLAEQLQRTVDTWAAGRSLAAYACDATRSDRRLPQMLAGRKPAGVIRADVDDLKPVKKATAAAGTLSTGLAAAVGQEHSARARRTWQQHHSWAHSTTAAQRLAAAQRLSERTLTEAPPPGRAPGELRRTR